MMAPLVFFGALGCVAAWRFPSPVDPEPVCEIAPDSYFKGGVYVAGDRVDRPRVACVIVGWDARADFDTPLAQARSVVGGGEQGTPVSKSEDGRGGSGGAVSAQETAPDSFVSAVLIGEQA